jgi:hypothetical protein
MNKEIDIETSLDEMLDDIYPALKIGNITFYPSRILKELDPIAYGCAISEHEDYLAQLEMEYN